MPGCLTNCWRPASSPALSRRWRVAHKLTGGLQLPNDETGDCQLFTQQLAKMAEQAGVTFLFNRSVDRLLVEGDKIAGVQCGEEVFKADSYVVAFGSYSGAAARHGVDTGLPAEGLFVDHSYHRRSGGAVLYGIG